MTKGAGFSETHVANLNPLENCQENIKPSFENESPTNETINHVRKDTFLDDVNLVNSLHNNFQHQDNVTILPQNTEIKTKEITLAPSNSDVETSLSIGDQLRLKRLADTNETDDKTSCYNDVAPQGNELELTTNCFQITDLCTLLSLETVESFKTGAFPLNVDKRRKHKAKAEQKLPKTDLQANLLFSEEKVSGVTHVRETVKREEKHNADDYVTHRTKNMLQTKGMSTTSTYFKKQKSRNKRKQKNTKENFPRLPPLLSLGLYDDVNLSMVDAMTDEKCSKPIVTYYKGSLIYQGDTNVGSIPENRIAGNKKNDLNHFTYEAGKYDHYLSDQNCSGTKTSYFDRMAFAGMQYAIRKELDNALQSNDNKQRNEKQDNASEDKINTKLQADQISDGKEVGQNTSMEDWIQKKSTIRHNEKVNEVCCSDSSRVQSQKEFLGSFKNTK